jgi:hypothetical protein
MATRKSSCNCGQLSVTYEGPDPERISLCQCYECQKRTGSAFSWQTRLPIEHVTIEGQSTTRRFPSDSGKPAEFRSCDSGGATYHFCPVCGSTVYWELAIAPGFLGVAVGTFADPTFSPSRHAPGGPKDPGGAVIAAASSSFSDFQGRTRPVS